MLCQHGDEMKTYQVSWIQKVTASHKVWEFFRGLPEVSKNVKNKTQCGGKIVWVDQCKPLLVLIVMSKFMVWDDRPKPKFKVVVWGDQSKLRYFALHIINKIHMYVVSVGFQVSNNQEIFFD